MEGYVDDDGLYSDEDLPLPFDELRGTQYITVKVFWCEAQQEWQLEDWFECYPVAVWNDPAWRRAKDQLPPWL